MYTVRDLHNLPPTLDIPTAAQLLGISRTKAYRLAKTNHFPCPILHIGNSY
ncbi:helix-turn-helix transcriptional regulator [Actinocorallia herbida]|uniref:helix-turn-helix transcriptional regulator n=1 Tax=Actinocorallia herbida TaxID=58109 RepID=UPI000F4B4949|nr:helix-turn-helix domain-containing protein [Actinocorallia herbida]